MRKFTKKALAKANGLRKKLPMPGRKPKPPEFNPEAIKLAIKESGIPMQLNPRMLTRLRMRNPGSRVLILGFSGFKISGAKPGEKTEFAYSRTGKLLSVKINEEWHEIKQ